MESKTRQSNIELLRCLAMFYILLVHACYYSQGSPIFEDFSNKPIDSTLLVLLESLSIVAVNVFVLISGWFSIRPRWKSALNFVFQCLFFSISIYALFLVTSWSEFSLRGLAQVFYATKINWFIKSYIGLYILAPVLNAFVEVSSRKVFKWVLISFFIFQTSYGWMTGAAEFFQQGYSTISFIGLYLLARYMNIYKPSWTKLPHQYDLLIYLGLALMLTAAITLCGILKPFSVGVGSFVMKGLMHVQTSYISPLVILASVSLLLYFSKLNIQSKLINWIASSSFAVFLIHANPNISPYFVALSRTIVEQIKLPVNFLVLLVVLGLIFLLSVLVDKIRIVSWTQTWTGLKKKVTFIS